MKSIHERASTVDMENVAKIEEGIKHAMGKGEGEFLLCIFEANETGPKQPVAEGAPPLAGGHHQAPRDLLLSYQPGPCWPEGN